MQADAGMKAVWLKMFGPVFLGFRQKIDPRDTPRSPGPAPHINLHQKSAPETNCKLISLWARGGCFRTHPNIVYGIRGSF